MTMKKNTSAMLCLGLILSSSASTAHDDKLEQLLSLSLEELMMIKVSIATQARQQISRAPAVVSVITADEIKATGATNLVDVLQGVPGIYIRANQFGNRPLVHFRGAAATQTLLMVNGAPVKDLVWSSGIFWKGLPANMIERVEIIRGPGSALFGSDASAGVINVITRTAGPITQSEVGARAGSFDTRAGWVRHGGKWNGFDVGFTAELSRTDGHRPLITADAQTAQDARAGINTRVSLAPGHANYGYDNQDLRFSIASGNWRLQADYMQHGKVETGVSGAGVLDPVTRGSDKRYNLDLLYNNENFAHHWGVNAELRYLHLDYASGNGFQERPPGFKCAGTCFGATAGTYPNGELNQMRSAERRTNVEVSGLYAGAKNHAIRIGGGYVWQDLYRVEQRVNFGKGPTGALLPAGGPLVSVTDTPYAFAPEKTRAIRYLFVQDVWTFAPAWELTAGLRHDHYSDFGSSLNPRLGLVWQGTDRFTMKLMFGQAFRAPSYQELYSPTANALPNARLAPERSRTWDLSLAYVAAKDFNVGLNLFHFAQTNLIAADASNQFQNAGDHQIRGFELEARWQATKSVRVSGNLTRRYQDDSPFTTFSVPDQEAYLRADWAFQPNWTWNLQANRTGPRSRPSTDTRAPLGGHTLVDTTLRYMHRKEWEFSASIRNLFDKDAREYTGPSIPSHLPLPRRSFFGEIRFKF